MVNTIDTKHPQVIELWNVWQKNHDCNIGNRQVRDGVRCLTYLPKLTTKQKDAAYLSYKNRGLFYEVTGRTVQALTGIALWKEPIIKLPKQIEDIIKIDDIKQTIEELLITGRIALLPDMDSDGNPRIAQYDAMSLLNYMPISEKEIDWATLSETRYKRNGYNIEQVDIIRELMINENGKYEQVIWEKLPGDDEYKRVDFVQPLRGGQPLDFIPLVILGTNRITTDIQCSPLQPVIDLNIWHYQRFADYTHGLHWCSLPTPFFKGNFEGEIGIGSGEGIICKDQWGDAKYLEFGGAGLVPIETALKKAEDMMAAMGARMIEHEKRAAESGEALRLRQAAETTNLGSIIAVVENAYHKALETICDWMGLNVNPEEAFQLQRDFISSKLMPQEIAAYMQAYQGGGMSLQTLIQELRLGEIGTNTVEEEMALIESQSSPSYFNDDDKDQATAKYEEVQE